MAGASDTLINTLFDGRYRILRKLGSGGMANVYLAEDEELGRRVAIKILNERYANDELFIERFRREAKSAAGLSHPNIVSIYDRGEAEGTYYIAMEVIEGRSLKELILTHGALPIDTAIAYAKQLLEALRFAHHHGIIHRDIKPHNVLVSTGPQVKATAPRLKVTDFGIARHGASQMTEAGSIMGTAQYLSPEQARGAPVTAASDLYSAGVVLYEMLTGKVPFTGDSAIEIAMKHVNELPKPPSKLRPGDPARARPGRPPLARQGSRRPLPDGRRVHRGPRAGRVRPAHRAARPPRPRPRCSPGRRSARRRRCSRGEEATRVVSKPPAPVPPRPPDYPPAGPYDEPPKKRKRWVPWVLVALLIAAAALAGWWAYNAIQDQLEASEPVGVPNVEGLRQDPAVQQIENAGLVAKVEKEASTEVEAGFVIDQSPDAGTQVAKESTVTITVSSGPKQVEVPKLVGKTYEQAVDLLDRGQPRSRSARTSSRIGPRAASPGRTRRPARRWTRARRSSSASPGAPSRSACPTSWASRRRTPPPSSRLPDFVVSVVEQPSSSVSAGVVSQQSPSGGADAPKGSTVTITVSTGPSQVNVPNVDRRRRGHGDEHPRGPGLHRARQVERGRPDGIVPEPGPGRRHRRPTRAPA